VLGRGRPGNIERGIGPQHPFLRLWIIKIRDFIDNLGILFQGAEAVCKTGGNEQLFSLFAGKLYRDVFAEGRGSLPQIERNIENSAAADADQLVLWAGRNLIMQPTHGSLGARKREIILDEGDGHASIAKRLLTVQLGEISSGIFEALGNNEKKARYLQFGDLHECTLDPTFN